MSQPTVTLTTCPMLRDTRALGYWLLKMFALNAQRTSSSPLEGQRIPPSTLPDQRDFCDRLWCGVRQGSQALPSRAIICRWYCRPCEGLRPNWPDYLWAGHLRGQSSEDVSGESGLITSAQGPELRGCLRRKWPDHLSSGHLETQSCEDVAGENGLNTSAKNVSEPRVARMSQAEVA